MKKYVCALMAIVLAIPCLMLASCKRENSENTVYTVTACYDGQATVTGKVAVDYFNNTETEITALKFNLYPNAFRQGAKHPPVAMQDVAKAYPNGISYGGITIEKCFCGELEADFEIGGKDENILVLRLKKGVFPAERVEVTVFFTLTLAECRLRTGYYNGVVNLGNWFPILCAYGEGGFYECVYAPVGDPFYSEVADYKVSITVPGEFTVASGGVCESTVVDGDRTTYVYSLQGVRDVALVLSKDFEVFVGKTGDIEVSFYYLSGDYASRVVEVACRAIERFSQLFGQYPYPALAIAQTHFLQGGMEYPQLVYVSGALELDELITATVHEIAHQWWYAVVGTNECEFAFLDEGLAEYSTLLFYEAEPEFGITRQGVVGAKTAEYRAFCGVYEQLVGKVNTRMARNLMDFKGEYEYVQIAYVKSFLMLDGFRTSVGDARFLKGLKRLYQRGAFSIVGPEHLISSFNFVGCDAEGYFTSWIEGKDIG